MRIAHASTFLTFVGLVACQSPPENHVRLVFQPALSMHATVGPAVLNATARALQQRLDAVAQGTVRRYSGRFVVDATTWSSPQELAALLGRTGRLELRLTDGQGRFAAALPKMDRALRRASVPMPTTVPTTALSQMFALKGPDTPGPLSAVLTKARNPDAYRVLEAEGPHAESLLARVEVTRAMPAGVALFWGASVTEQGSERYRTLYALQDSVLLDNAAVKRALARRDVGGGTLVLIKLTPSGSAGLCTATSRHVNEFLAILIDGRVQGEPPVIRDSICGGGVQIELGSKPLAEARDLAVVFGTEPLPVPIMLVDDRALRDSSAGKR